jgi:hypothetical protein
VGRRRAERRSGARSRCRGEHAPGSLRGATAQAQLQAEPDPGTLEVWPPGATLAAGTALPLAVTLVTGSGDSTDVTTDAVWTSSLPGWRSPPMLRVSTGPSSRARRAARC